MITEAAPSSKHVHSMALDSSCWARSWPSCSLTRTSVGTSAWFMDSEIRLISKPGISMAATNASMASERP